MSAFCGGPTAPTAGDFTLGVGFYCIRPGISGIGGRCWWNTTLGPFNAKLYRVSTTGVVASALGVVAGSTGFVDFLFSVPATLVVDELYYLGIRDVAGAFSIQTVGNVNPVAVALVASPMTSVGVIVPFVAPITSQQALAAFAAGDAMPNANNGAFHGNMINLHTSAVALP